jgi:hypothetical protein
MSNWSEIGRIVFAIIFLLGAIANIVIVISTPEMYSGFADLSILSVYHSLWSRIVMPNLQFFIVSIAVFEFLIAILLLTRMLYVRIGMYLGIIFMLFLFPFWWSGGSIINLVFAFLLLLLAFEDYPRSIPNVLLQGSLSKSKKLDVTQNGRT